MFNKLVKILCIALIVSGLLPLSILALTATPPPTPSRTPTPTSCLCPVTISVTVLDSVGAPITGAPIAGADVYFYESGEHYITDTAGTCSIKTTAYDPSCGYADFYLFATANGYQKGSKFFGSACNSIGLTFFLVKDPVSGLAGDVNGSGVTDIVDALMVARYVTGLVDTGFNSALADVNSDGKITIVDALIISQFHVGLITQLPIA